MEKCGKNLVNPSKLGDTSPKTFIEPIKSKLKMFVVFFWAFNGQMINSESITKLRPEISE